MTKPGDVKLANGMAVNRSCPNCLPRVKMVVRENRETGEQFLACPNYPRCRETDEIPFDVLARAFGQQELFDGER